MCLRNTVFWDLLLFTVFVLIGYEEKPMVILVPSYNNIEWVKRNLDSIFIQKYGNYRVLYIDDYSTDGTGDFVEQYIRDNNLTNKTVVIRNSRRAGAMENIYKAIHFNCADDEVIVKLDGDDWFAHDQVLLRINREYQNSDVWLTYGNSCDWRVGWQSTKNCAPIAQNIISSNTFRLAPIPVICSYTPGHPFTFYVWLFKLIKLEDILYEGKMPSIGYDSFMNLAMFEMASFHFKYISEILYIHNIANTINDYKVNPTLQRKIAFLNFRRTPYQPLNRAKPIQYCGEKIDLMVYLGENFISLSDLEKIREIVLQQSIQSVSVVYRSCTITDDEMLALRQRVINTFHLPKACVSIIKCASGCDVRRSSLDALNISTCAFILVLTNINTLKNTLNVESAIVAIKETGACKFSFSLDKERCEARKIPYVNLNDYACSYQLKFGAIINSVDAALYTKESFIRDLYAIEDCQEFADFKQQLVNHEATLDHVCLFGTSI